MSDNYLLSLMEWNIATIVITTIIRIRAGIKHRQHRRAHTGPAPHKNKKLLTGTVKYTRSTSM